jgi:IclR family pca regulon transcriptional regulator
LDGRTSDRDESAPRRRSRDYIAALGRGLDLVEALASSDTPLSISEAAVRIGADRAVARRLLLTLVQTQYAQTDGRVFSLSPLALSFGYDYLGKLGLDGELDERFYQFSREIQEPIVISVLDGPDVLFVGRHDAVRHRLNYHAKPGYRFPAIGSSSGRMLLSELPPDVVRHRMAQSPITAYTEHSITDPARLLERVRIAGGRGYDLNAQESDLDIVGASVLLRNEDEKVIGALNVSSVISRRTLAELERAIVPEMLAFARRIAKSIPNRDRAPAEADLHARLAALPAPAKGDLAGAETVASLTRGLDVLSSFRTADYFLSIGEAAASSGLDRAVARRILKTLAAHRHLRETGRWYTLTPSVLRLGFGELAAQDLATLIGPFLDALSTRMRRPVSVLVRQGAEVLCLANADQSGRRLSYALERGATAPARMTAAGELLGRAADPRGLPGYVRRKNELDIAGLTGIAVPLRTCRGTCIAALTSAEAVGSAPTELTSTLAALKETARTLSRCLRWPR